jgi:hypothetical protein
MAAATPVYVRTCSAPIYTAQAVLADCEVNTYMYTGFLNRSAVVESQSGTTSVWVPVSSLTAANTVRVGTYTCSGSGSSLACNFNSSQFVSFAEVDSLIVASAGTTGSTDSGTAWTLADIDNLQAAGVFGAGFGIVMMAYVMSWSIGIVLRGIRDF